MRTIIDGKKQVHDYIGIHVSLDCIKLSFNEVQVEYTKTEENTCLVICGDRTPKSIEKNYMEVMFDDLKTFVSPANTHLKLLELTFIDFLSYYNFLMLYCKTFPTPPRVTNFWVNYMSHYPNSVSFDLWCQTGYLKNCKFHVYKSFDENNWEKYEIKLEYNESLNQFDGTASCSIEPKEIQT
uniref:FBA_2 domain-containing protein n=1 Tax=Caenorhabditis tropicalis TaxID=1561998 RepID=A0A1I7TL61_9PELO